ncbi:MAG: hypothetical protein IJN66_03860 [Muribaculaceae bacterium]|nr:hypothetical protein [Muribaculaceae bacterium]
MKKSLLLASALLCAASSFAADMTIGPDADDVTRKTDPATYEKFGDYELKNRWMLSRNTDGSEVLQQYLPEKTQVSAVVLDTTIYVARPDNGSLLKFGLSTGRYLGELKLTLDSEPIGTGIGAMLNLTKDDFGHLVYHGYKATLGTNSETGDEFGGIMIYYVSNLETGECALAADLNATEDELLNAYKTGRIDYSAVAGDITRQEARAVVIAGGGANAGLQIYGWECEEGSEEWKGCFPDKDGMGNPDVIMLAPVAADNNASGWAGATAATIVYDPEYKADYFYIDGMGNMPGLYDRNGNFVENGTHHIEEVLNEETGETTKSAVRNFGADWYVSAANATGIIEFTLNGVNFVAYADGDHGATTVGGGNAKIAKLGDNFEWTADAGAEMAWAHVPAGGVGTTSDGGRRKIMLSASILTDANNVEGAYFLVGHNYNGMALYSIAPEGWQDPNGEVNGIEDIVVDDVEGAAKYYNLQGVEIANPENGLYIVKRGNKVSKELVK